MTTVDIPDYDGAYQAKPDTPERFYLCTAFNFGLTCKSNFLSPPLLFFMPLSPFSFTALFTKKLTNYSHILG